MLNVTLLSVKAPSVINFSGVMLSVVLMLSVVAPNMLTRFRRKYYQQPLPKPAGVLPSSPEVRPLRPEVASAEIDRAAVVAESCKKTINDNILHFYSTCYRRICVFNELKSAEISSR
jgi:hypothetical protein